MFMSYSSHFKLDNTKLTLMKECLKWSIKKKKEFTQIVFEETAKHYFIGLNNVPTPNSCLFGTPD